jgi:hypothetical protein
MDKQIDLEALRSRLAKMSRVEVLALADKAGLKRSTLEKFRLKHIYEPRLSKLEAIRDALAKDDKLTERRVSADRRKGLRRKDDKPTQTTERR